MDARRLLVADVMADLTRAAAAVRTIIIAFRTVEVTIWRDMALSGAAIEVRHRRATNKQAVALRGDEAEFVEAVRGLLIGRNAPGDPEFVARLARAFEGALPGRMSTPEDEWALYCREVAERVEELL